MRPQGWGGLGGSGKGLGRRKGGGSRTLTTMPHNDPRATRITVKYIRWGCGHVDHQSPNVPKLQTLCPRPLRCCAEIPNLSHHLHHLLQSTVRSRLRQGAAPPPPPNTRCFDPTHMWTQTGKG